MDIQTISERDRQRGRHDTARKTDIETDNQRDRQ